MVAPQGTPPDEPRPSAPAAPPAAPPLTGYTVPTAWSSVPAPRAPGTVIAAAVLTYIRGGLGILASGFLVVGGSLIDELDLFWVIIGVAGLAVSVLYVVAALLLQLRRHRAFLLSLTIVDIALGVIGVVEPLTRSAADRASGGGSTCSLLLPIIVLVLLRHRNTTEWIEAHRGVPGQLPR